MTYGHPTLDERLRKAAAAHGADVDGHANWYALAYQVLLHFCGDEWCGRYVRLSTSPDPFMLNSFDEGSETRYAHVQRVIDLADNLYRLKDVQGFDLLVARLGRRDVRSVYFEAEAAASLQHAGYGVCIRQESGTKGRDFDFDVEYEGIKLAAEVSAKDDDSPLTEQSVLNTLEQKRKQLPSDRAALLFVVIPQAWTALPHAEAVISNATAELMRTSRRINAVTYMWTDWVDVPKGGRASADVFRPFLHPNPRQPLPALEFVLKRASPRDYLSVKASIAGGDTSLLEGPQELPSFAVGYVAA